MTHAPGAILAVLEGDKKVLYRIHPRKLEIPKEKRYPVPPGQKKIVLFEEHELGAELLEKMTLISLRVNDREIPFSYVNSVLPTVELKNAFDQETEVCLTFADI